MHIDKDSIKKWLKSKKRDRNWLADKCLVTKSAIDKWFNRGGIIPFAKIELIKRLMNDEINDCVNENPQKSSYPILNGVASIPVLLDNEELELVTWAANELGVRIEEFLKRAAVSDAERFYADEAAKKNPTGTKSVGTEGVYGDTRSSLSPERRYLRAAKLDESETA